MAYQDGLMALSFALIVARLSMFRFGSEKKIAFGQSS